MTTSRANAQPVNLKDRIAALQQRSVSGPSTSSANPPPSTKSNELPRGNLRAKIAKFEQRGGTPVPRGSFGLGAPPMDDGGSKRRGELYGNRIPTIPRQLTGGSQPSYGRSGSESPLLRSPQLRSSSVSRGGNNAVQPPPQVQVDGVEFPRHDNYHQHHHQQVQQIEREEAIVHPSTPPPKKSRSFTRSLQMSSEDSIPVLTPPSPSFYDTGSGNGRERRTSSTWGSPKKSGSVGAISRASSFAEKIWSRGRKTSTQSVITIDSPDESNSESSSLTQHPPSSHPPPRVTYTNPLGLGLSLSPTTAQGARPMSWATSSTTSSPDMSGFDSQIFDAFPAVPQDILTPLPPPVTAVPLLRQRPSTAGGSTHEVMGGHNEFGHKTSLSLGRSTTLPTSHKTHHKEDSGGGAQAQPTRASIIRRKHY
ncbi:hypothetical protein JAAARDRAFT_575929 [Jaapia argillacea MUCL 33604]|uniref:Uncharacterized protein n=1 Tax=Jaapia argillacea MUCL 33604 TaxID=933084 RepID=A0A067QF34_9AGAM|nr:hypothetical protein JAAARDRAFT_575929 [Jaapia argillacea MUCL 33604]